MKKYLFFISILSLAACNLFPISFDLPQEMNFDINQAGTTYNGTKVIDPTNNEQFKKNWAAVKKAEITRGAYHFFIPSKSGRAQAQNFIETVTLDTGDLPPVLDVEHINSTSLPKLQLGVQEWLLLVEAHYHVKPIIYTNSLQSI